MAIEKITDHSDQALLRLPDKLKGKANIEALLRSKASARIGIDALSNPQDYTIIINNLLYEYTSILTDTKASISSAIKDAINAEVDLIEYFECFDDGDNFEGSRIHGTWIPGVVLAGSKPFIVQSDDVYSGFNGIRTDFSELPLASTVAIGTYPGITLDAQRAGISFKIPSTFPGPSLETQAASVSLILFAWNEGGVLTPACNFRYTPKSPGPGYEFQVILEETFGGVGVNTYNIPTAALADDQWHTILLEFDKAGTYLNVDIDEGAFGGTNVIANPVTPTAFFFLTTSPDISPPLSDVPNISYDNLILGTELTTGLGDALALKLDEEDDFLYLKARQAGTELVVKVS